MITEVLHYIVERHGDFLEVVALGQELSACQLLESGDGLPHVVVEVPVVAAGLEQARIVL